MILDVLVSQAGRPDPPGASLGRVSIHQKSDLAEPRLTAARAADLCDRIPHARLVPVMLSQVRHRDQPLMSAFTNEPAPVQPQRAKAASPDIQIRPPGSRYPILVVSKGAKN